MADQNEMDSFIRNYFSGITRVREASAQPSDAVVRQTTTFIPDTPNPIAAEPATSGASFLGGGDSINFPFKITTKNGEDPTYKVAYNSSIIDGTNGGPFAINGLNEDKELKEQKFIIAEADVNDLVITSFTIKEVDEGGTDEVLFASGKQTKLRLLIGKITVSQNEGTYVLTPWQAVTTSFRTAIAVHNAISCIVLEVAPTHQSRI